MNSTRTWEIPAVRFDDLELNQEQPRLLIITDPSVFLGSDQPATTVQPDWTEDGILDVMSWSDVSAATGRWNRAVIVCPEVSMTDINDSAFGIAWMRWTHHMCMDLATKLKLHFWQSNGYKDRAMFVRYYDTPEPREVEITFYTGEFFDLYDSAAAAWEFILLISLRQPGTDPRLYDWDYTAPMDGAPAEHFADGKVLVYTTYGTGDQPTKEVLLLNRDGARAFILPERNLDQSEDSDY